MHQIIEFVNAINYCTFFKLSFDFAIWIMFIIMHSLWRDAVISCEVRTPVEGYLGLQVGPCPTGKKHQVHSLLLVLYHSLFLGKKGINSIFFPV